MRDREAGRQSHEGPPGFGPSLPLAKRAPKGHRGSRPHCGLGVGSEPLHTQSGRDHTGGPRLLENKERWGLVLG